MILTRLNRILIKIPKKISNLLPLNEYQPMNGLLHQDANILIYLSWFGYFVTEEKICPRFQVEYFFKKENTYLKDVVFVPNFQKACILCGFF